MSVHPDDIFPLPLALFGVQQHLEDKYGSRSNLFVFAFSIWCWAVNIQQLYLNLLVQKAAAGRELLLQAAKTNNEIKVPKTLSCSDNPLLILLLFFFFFLPQTALVKVAHGHVTQGH